LPAGKCLVAKGAAAAALLVPITSFIYALYGCQDGTKYLSIKGGWNLSIQSIRCLFYVVDHKWNPYPPLSTIVLIVHYYLFLKIVILGDVFGVLFSQS
tara:strand:- start:168 stop:461 length:294 start_codon:yes stop_codon:yes gene_type:complete